MSGHHLEVTPALRSYVESKLARVKRHFDHVIDVNCILSVEKLQQKIEATETITRREPADLHGIPSDTVVHFEREIVATGMWSAARERLIEVGPEQTLWESENEYRFKGLLMRLVGPFMRGAFRKQSRQHMLDFKAFAEQGTDVREAKG